MKENNYLFYITKVWFATFAIAPILGVLLPIFFSGIDFGASDYFLVFFVLIIFSVPSFLILLYVGKYLSQTNISNPNYRLSIAGIGMIVLILNNWLIAIEGEPNRIIDVIISLKFHLMLLFLFSQVLELKRDIGDRKTPNESILDDNF